MCSAGPRGETVLRFDSPAEFARAAEAAGPVEAYARASWTGKSWNDALRDAMRGDARRVAEAEALLERVQSQIDAPRSEWVPAFAGAYPVVGDFLAGRPESMRRRVEASSDHAPLRVVVDLTSSGGISWQDAARRGVAYLALAMALSNERAVELWVVIALGSARATGIIAVRIPSAPLDLAVACEALTSVAFCRSLGYSLLDKTCGTRGGWAWDLSPYVGEKDEYARRMRAALELTESDVLAPPLFIADAAVRDPVAFVQRELAAHAAKERE